MDLAEPQEHVRPDASKAVTCIDPLSPCDGPEADRGPALLDGTRYQEFTDRFVIEAEFAAVMAAQCGQNEGRRA
jgi:hypothetical protein